MEGLKNMMREKGVMFYDSDMVNLLFIDAVRNSDDAALKIFFFSGSPILSCQVQIGGRNGTFLHYICGESKPNIVAAKLLISYGVDINKRNENGNTALHIASGAENKNQVSLNMIKVLLNSGANQNIRNNQGLLPIHVVLLSNKLEEAEEFLKKENKLLDGIHHDRTSRCRNLVKSLILKGHHFYLSDINYSVLLHFLLFENDEETFEHVAKNTKYDLNSVCPFYKYSENYSTYTHTLLITIIKEGTVEMIRALFHAGADLDSECSCCGVTPLIAAIKMNKIEICNFLIDCGVSVSITKKRQFENNSPLHHAICLQNTQIVKRLLKMGADVNACYYRSPLLLACGWNTQNTIWPIPSINDINYRESDCSVRKTYDIYFSFPRVEESQFSVQLVKILLDHGADMEAKSASNRTPLDNACRFGQIEIVKLLLSRGAKINQGDVSSLNHAIRGENLSVIKLILEKGANVNCICEPEKSWSRNQLPLFPKTPLECALFSIKKDSTCKEVIEVLMEYGLDVNATYPECKQAPLHMPYLSHKQRFLIIENEFFIKAATIQILLEGNANINALDIKGYVPLHYALSNYTSLQYIRSIAQYNVDFDPKENIVTLIAFIAKMIEMGEFVAKENLELLKDASILPLYQECVNELRLMKKNICESRNFSFFNILSTHIDILGSTFKIKKVLEVLDSGEYKKEFPIYAKYLENRIREATMVRQPLIDLAIVLFQKQIHKNMPIEVILIIFKFINRFDLQNFTKAF